MLKNIVTTNLKNSSFKLEGFTFTSFIKPASSNFKCGGYACYAGTVDFTFLGITQTETGLVCPSLTISIKGNAAHVTAKGSKVLLENCSGSATGSFFEGESPAGEISVTAQIINAGQSEVKAE